MFTILREIFLTLARNLFVSGSHRMIKKTFKRQRKKLTINGILTQYPSNQPPMAGPIINHRPNTAPNNQKFAARSL